MHAMIFITALVSISPNVSAAYHCNQTLQEHTQSITKVALSPNGRTLVSGSPDGIVKIWELDNGQWVCVQTLDDTVNGHTNTVNSITFSPDGTLVSGSSDNTIKIWLHFTPTTKAKGAQTHIRPGIEGVEVVAAPAETTHEEDILSGSKLGKRETNLRPNTEMPSCKKNTQ